MTDHRRVRTALALLVLLGAAACGGDDPTLPEPEAVIDVLGVVVDSAGTLLRGSEIFVRAYVASETSCSLVPGVAAFAVSEDEGKFTARLRVTSWPADGRACITVRALFPAERPDLRPDSVSGIRVRFRPGAPPDTLRVTVRLPFR